MVRGNSTDYENMVNVIKSNQYFLESFSYIDEELSKYTNESNLTWWAMAFVGVFQDLVDVEAIGNIVPQVAFDSFSFESHTNYTTWVEFICDSSYSLYPLENGQFMIFTSETNCISAASIGSRYLDCALSKCPPLNFDSEEEWEACVSDCRGGLEDPEPLPVTPDCISICYSNYLQCCSLCDCDKTDCSCLNFCVNQYIACKNLCSGMP